MDDERPVTAEPAREKMSAGAKAILIVLPVALLLFGIDAVVLITGDAADRAARAKHPVTEVAPTPPQPDAAGISVPSASAGSSASAATPLSARPATSAAPSSRR